jgi:hypothetical protein
MNSYVDFNAQLCIGCLEPMTYKVRYPICPFTHYRYDPLLDIDSYRKQVGTYITYKYITGLDGWHKALTKEFIDSLWEYENNNLAESKI